MATSLQGEVHSRTRSAGSHDLRSVSVFAHKSTQELVGADFSACYNEPDLPLPLLRLLSSRSALWCEREKERKSEREQERQRGSLSVAVAAAAESGLALRSARPEFMSGLRRSVQRERAREGAREGEKGGREREREREREEDLRACAVKRDAHILGNALRAISNLSTCRCKRARMVAWLFFYV